MFKPNNLDEVETVLQVPIYFDITFLLEMCWCKQQKHFSRSVFPTPNRKGIVSSWMFQNLSSFRQMEGCWEGIGRGHKGPFLISPLGHSFPGLTGIQSYLYDPGQSEGMANRNTTVIYCSGERV